MTALGWTVLEWTRLHLWESSSAAAIICLSPPWRIWRDEMTYMGIWGGLSANTCGCHLLAWNPLSTGGPAALYCLFAKLNSPAAFSASQNFTHSELRKGFLNLNPLFPSYICSRWWVLIAPLTSNSILFLWLQTANIFSMEATRY